MIGEISRCRQKWYNSSHCWFDWSETPATCDRAWSYLLEWDLMKILRRAWFASRKIHFCDRHFGAQNLSGMQRANHKPKQGYAEYGIITWIPLWNLCTQFHCVSILRDINCWGSPAQDLYLNNAEQVMNTAPKSFAYSAITKLSGLAEHSWWCWFIRGVARVSGETFLEKSWSYLTNLTMCVVLIWCKYDCEALCDVKSLHIVHLMDCACHNLCDCWTGLDGVLEGHLQHGAPRLCRRFYFPTPPLDQHKVYPACVAFVFQSHLPG